MYFVWTIFIVLEKDKKTLFMMRWETKVIKACDEIRLSMSCILQPITQEF